MFLLDGEIKGAARLREVAQMLFDGDNEYAPQTNKRIVDTPSIRAQPRVSASEILPRILPNTHSRTLFLADKGGVGLVRDRRVARAARLVEAARAMTELATVGIHTGLVVANLVLPPEQCTTAYT